MPVTHRFFCRVDRDHGPRRSTSDEAWVDAEQHRNNNPGQSHDLTVISEQSEGDANLFIEESYVHVRDAAGRVPHTLGLQTRGSSLLKSTTRSAAPLDASGGEAGGPSVSDFITLQSLTNFGVMTASISIAWRILRQLSPVFAATWVPFAFAAAWGGIAIVMSYESLKTSKGNLAGGIFVALINSLVLASAVLGADDATTTTP